MLFRSERCGSGCMDSDGTCCGGGFFCYLDETCKYSDSSSKVECCVFGSCAAAKLVRLSSLGNPITTRTSITSAPEDSLSTTVRTKESGMGGIITFLATSTRVQQPESTVKSIEVFARDWESKSCKFCICHSSDNQCPPGCC